MNKPPSGEIWGGCFFLPSTSKELYICGGTEEVFQLSTTLLSLVQFVSGDDLAELYYPLMLARPELSLIFMPLLVIVTVGLMNLVPAILLENQAREKEFKQITGRQRFQKLAKELEKVFAADGVREVSHGWLSTADFIDTLGAFKLDELFEVLVRKLCPGDPDPVLPVDEFLEAAMELLVLEVPLSTRETLAILRLSFKVSWMERSMHDVEEHLESFTERSQESMEKLEESINDLHQKVDKIMFAFQFRDLPAIHVPLNPGGPWAEQGQNVSRRLRLRRRGASVSRRVTERRRSRKLRTKPPKPT